jgi:hypothetical protein
MESKIVNTGDDITGSIIESDKPVGVFSGNEETFINDKSGFFQTEHSCLPQIQACQKKSVFL